MTKSTVKTYIKNTVDPLFSRYIRLKAAKEMDGWCKCVTCGEVKPWYEMDCGHYEQRGSLMTRFDERNVGPQCVSCNRFGEGNKAAFAIYLKEKYGDGILDELHGLSRQLWLGSAEQKMEELKVFVHDLHKEIELLEGKEGSE